MRLVAFAFVSSLVATAAGRAWAAGECPGGDWFCDDAPVPAPGGPAPAPAEQRGSAAPPPPAPLEALEPGERAEREERIRLDVERVEPAEPRRRRHRYREWGVNLHAALGLMGDEPYAAPDAGMNGLGGALRFRPIRYIAIEGALELLWGTDYNGFDRFETGVLVSGLFFVNPRSAVQIYGVAGFGVGGAWLSDGYGGERTYSYVGGQLGFGVEARITRHYAIGGDLLGFVRRRNDRHAAVEPEFVEPVSHRTSNASGGGIVRLGATFYW